jgi:hypothetical protein
VARIAQGAGAGPRVGSIHAKECNALPRRRPPP